MGIKNKKRGPRPIFQSLWQNLAVEGRVADAIRQYRLEMKEDSFIVAHRAVMSLRNKWK